MINHTIQTDPFNLAGGYSRLENNYIFEPSQTPLKLYYEPNVKFFKECEAVFDSSLTLSLILFDDGKIIYERYRNPASKSTPMFTWSISKSLVAWLFGHVIGEINNALKKYSNFPFNQKMKETDIFHYLTMSSGFILENINLFPTLKNLECSQTKLFKSDITDLFDSGSSFLYNDLDTQVLIQTIIENGNWKTLFENFIVKPSRLKNRSYWLHDIEKFPIGFAGYSSTNRDMLRLAIRFSHLIKEKKYFEDMVSPQVLNNPKTNGFRFDYYGYQTWCSEDCFWWLGMSGQRVGIDLEKNKILITSRLCEFHIDKVYNLFKTFQQL